MSTPWKRNYSKYRTYFINNLANYKKRQDVRSYLELLLSLLTIIIFSVFALKPTLTTIATLIREIESKEETLLEIDNKISDLKRAQELYNSEKSKIELIENVLNSQPDPVLIVTQIEGATGEVDVLVNSMSLTTIPIVGAATDPQSKPSNKKKEEGLDYKTIELALNLSSNYTSAIDLVSNLQSLRLPINILSLSFNSGDVNSNLIDVNVKGVIPYLTVMP